MPSSSAYITVKDYKQTYHFTGVLSVNHQMLFYVLQQVSLGYQIES